MPSQFENNIPPVNNPASEVEIIKPKRNYPFLLTLTLLLILTGIFGVWYFSNPLPDEDIDTSTIIKHDQFADWKTYRNDFFSIKLPQSWSVTEETPAGENFTIRYPDGKVGNIYVFTQKEWQGYQNAEELPIVLAKDSLGNIYTYARSQAIDPLKWKEVETELDEAISTFKFISTSTSMTIDTSNWKTYTNEQYGFEFKYPAGWKFETNKNSVSLNSPENQKCELCRLDIVIAFDKNTKNFEAKNYYNGKNGILAFDNPSEDIEIKIDGRVAYKLFPTTGEVAGELVIIPLNGIFIRFDINYSKETELMLNQILSTFKFISTSTSTAIDMSNNTGILGPKGGTIKTQDEIVFSLSEGSLNTEVEFEIKLLSKDQIIGLLPGQKISYYSFVEIIPLPINNSKAPAGTKNYSSTITVPLRCALQSGTKLKILEPNSVNNNWATTDYEAIVDRNGKIATVNAPLIGKLLFVREQDRGVENNPTVDLSKLCI
jgi:hypothetical protein